MICVVSVDQFFFFQAEDGIRDIGVTGVQTCALPILPVLGDLGLRLRLRLRRRRLGRLRLGLLRRGRRRLGRGRRDRKSVVWGKSVDLGGRRIIKKKKKVNSSCVKARTTHMMSRTLTR